MISKKSVLAIIVARGGSKGLPGKNIATLNGRPLVAWSVIAAKKSRYVDRIILSSDDGAIISAAKKSGCEVPFVRPAALATDTASVYDVIFHALENVEQAYDYIVLLQATSPLRISEDIDGCIAFCEKINAPVVSVCEMTKPPQWMFHISKNNKLLPIMLRDKKPSRRQDVQPVFIPNGAVFVAPTNQLRRNKTFYTQRTHAYVMPTERSVDIDTMADLLLARSAAILGAKKKMRKKSPERQRNDIQI